MTTDNTMPDRKDDKVPEAPQQEQQKQEQGGQSSETFDGLQGKKPEELTPEELRLMADTMPGEGPGD
jgi:hypothetical protein